MVNSRSAVFLTLDQNCEIRSAVSIVITADVKGINAAVQFRAWLRMNASPNFIWDIIWIDTLRNN
jgi:hypothetical protein